MANFSQIIAQWETFYLLAGTAAATLIGLLFVAISINIESFRGKAYGDLQLFATLTFNCFFYVLFIALIFLIPGLSALGLGIPLFLLGTLGLANAVVQQRRARRVQRQRGGADIASRFSVPMLGLLILAIIGILIMVRLAASLYAVIVPVVLLLGSAAVNAWVLLGWTEEQETAVTSRDD
ncbi:MAG: hypothetical protein ACK2UC_01610 [Anaerolineae bacterium]|jgi:hypothetical protein